MHTIIVCNVLLIACAGMLGFFFAPDDFPRPFFAAWAAWATFCLSLTGWAIFVAVHFISMHW